MYSKNKHNENRITKLTANICLHPLSTCSVWNENDFFHPSACFSATSDETLRREIPSFLGRSVSRAPPAVTASTTLKSLNRIIHHIFIHFQTSFIINYNKNNDNNSFTDICILWVNWISFTHRERTWLYFQTTVKKKKIIR